MSGWKFATILRASREIMVSEEGDDVEDQLTGMGQLAACEDWLDIGEGEDERESREGEDEELEEEDESEGKGEECIKKADVWEECFPRRPVGSQKD
uniref:Uncharacterized protein n=1 Tax=Amphimedon queenslandica TaxID=400682 RepID=A0A1X7UF78_AMPQE